MIEKFLNALVALVAAIEANTAALKGAAVAPAAAGAKTETKKEKEARLAAEAAAALASTPPPVVPPVTATVTPVVTFPAQEELTKVANALLDENDNNPGDFFKGIKEKYGVDKIRNIAEKDRADVIKLINDKRAELKAAKAAATAGKNDI